jgi:uncharacterized protein YceH (UPF0502 family)
MPWDLSAVEVRVLGCLIEKERTTPDYYPLTLNGLISACNQTTNRAPIVHYDERTVEAGLDGLRSKKLAMLLHMSGSRVPKYRHTFLEVYNLNEREMALLCVLLLRGAQTPGELRSRSERLGGSLTLAEVESSLEGLAQGDDPLVRVLPARPGQKERRYVQLLSPQSAAAEIEEQPPEIVPLPNDARLEALQAEVESLKTALETLRAEFDAFKSQFEA